MTNVFEGSGGDVAPVLQEAISGVQDIVQTADEDFAVLLQAFERWQDAGPVKIELPDPQSAWIILAALQLAWRHPAAPLRQYIERCGRMLQDAICDQADIYGLAEAGWKPERDL